MADRTPQAVKGQAALFQEPTQLLELPDDQFNRLIVEYGRKAGGGYRKMRREVGLLVWAQRHRLGEGPFGRWAEGYAELVGVDERTLRNWRQAVERDEGLPTPQASLAKQNRRSGERAESFPHPEEEPWEPTIAAAADAGSAGPSAPSTTSGAAPADATSSPSREGEATSAPASHPETAPTRRGHASPAPGSEPEMPAFEHPLAREAEASVALDGETQSLGPVTVGDPLPTSWKRGVRREEIEANFPPTPPALVLPDYPTAEHVRSVVVWLTARDVSYGSKLPERLLMAGKDWFKRALGVQVGVAAAEPPTPEANRDCPHPKGQRKNLGYVVKCGKCGAVISVWP